jgi:hypothetical protein
VPLRIRGRLTPGRLAVSGNRAPGQGLTAAGRDAGGVLGTLYPEGCLTLLRR